MQLTVKDLNKLCQEQIDKGNGNKKIIVHVSAVYDADEAFEEYHGLHCGFTETEGDLSILYTLYNSDTTLDDLIILD